MDAKLTLKLDESIIEKAKRYAQSQGISLSKMVESYLNMVTTENKESAENVEITPLVKSISGVIELPADFDYKKDYSDYIEQKYR